MVLNAHGAGTIGAVLNLGGHHPVDLNFDFVPLTGDAVFVPAVALKAVTGTLAEGFALAVRQLTPQVS